MKRFTLICALVAFLFTALSSPAAELGRGHQWIRTHPFTLNAICEWPMTLDTYKEAGFTSYLVYVNEKYYPAIFEDVQRLGFD
jgi:hypothetical protein